MGKTKTYKPEPGESKSYEKKEQAAMKGGKGKGKC
jgi:hypothetical protein